MELLHLEQIQADDSISCGYGDYELLFVEGDSLLSIIVPLNHSLEEYYLLFPSILSESKLLQNIYIYIYVNIYNTYKYIFIYICDI